VPEARLGGGAALQPLENLTHVHLFVPMGRTGGAYRPAAMNLR